MLRGRPQIHFQHIVSRLLLEYLKPHHEPRVIVNVSNQVQLTPAHPHHHDIALPHLIRCAPLKPAWLLNILLARKVRLRNLMAIFYQSGAYCPDTHRQMKEISCSVNNTTKAKFWITVLEGKNRVPDGGVNLLARSPGHTFGIEGRLAHRLVFANPAAQHSYVYTRLFADGTDGMPIFHMKLH